MERLPGNKVAEIYWSHSMEDLVCHHKEHKINVLCSPKGG